MIRLAEVGKKSFDQESVDREVTLDEALYMLSTHRLGRSAYTSMRHDLMQKVDLPAHYKIMQHEFSNWRDRGLFKPL